MASGFHSSTNTTSEIPGGTRFSSRAACGLSRVSVIRLCVEGERACPPEDVGGTSGYEEFLHVLTDPSDDQHEQFVTWIGGSFDPDNFDSEKATKRMRRGLPDWRKLA